MFFEVCPLCLKNSWTKCWSINYKEISFCTYDCGCGDFKFVIKKDKQDCCIDWYEFMLNTYYIYVSNTENRTTIYAKDHFHIISSINYALQIDWKQSPEQILNKIKTIIIFS